MSLINNISSSDAMGFNPVSLKSIKLMNLNAKVSQAVQFGKYIIVSGMLGVAIGFVATMGAPGGILIGFFGGVSTGTLYFVIKRNREISQQQQEIKKELKNNSQEMIKTCNQVDEIADRLLETQTEAQRDIKNAKGNVEKAQSHIEDALNHTSTVIDLCEESIVLAKNIAEVFTSAIQNEKEIEAEVIQPKVEVNRAALAAERFQRLQAQQTTTKNVNEMTFDDFADEMLEYLNKDTQEKPETNEFDFLNDALEFYINHSNTNNNVIKPNGSSSDITQPVFSQAMNQFEAKKREVLFSGIKKTNYEEALRDLSKLETNFETAKSTIHDLQNQLTLAQNELTEAKKSLEASDEKIQSMDLEIDRLKQKIQELVKKTNESDKKIDELQGVDNAGSLFLSFGVGVAITAMAARII